MDWNTDRLEFNKILTWRIEGLVYTCLVVLMSSALIDAQEEVVNVSGAIHNQFVNGLYTLYSYVQCDGKSIWFKAGTSILTSCSIFYDEAQSWVVGLSVNPCTITQLLLRADPSNFTDSVSPTDVRLSDHWEEFWMGNWAENPNLTITTYDLRNHVATTTSRTFQPTRSTIGLDTLWTFRQTLSIKPTLWTIQQLRSVTTPVWISVSYQHAQTTIGQNIRLSHTVTAIALVAALLPTAFCVLLAIILPIIIAVCYRRRLARNQIAIRRRSIEEPPTPVLPRQPSNQVPAYGGVSHQGLVSFNLSPHSSTSATSPVYVCTLLSPEPVSPPPYTQQPPPGYTDSASISRLSSKSTYPGLPPPYNAVEPDDVGSTVVTGESARFHTHSQERSTCSTSNVLPPAYDDHLSMETSYEGRMNIS